MIYLTGFMGSGKSTVGRRLARAMDLPFVDLDSEICKRAGSSIPEIFQAAGEEAFRYLERQSLRELVLAGEEAVVATGGGLPVDPANRRLMKASGYTVYLRAEFETLKARVPADSGRPNWRDDAQQLFESRQSAYADCDFIIDTDGLEHDAVVELVMQRCGALDMPVPVLTGDKPYPVYIAKIDRIAELIARHSQPDGLFVLVDENVKRLHSSRIDAALDGLRQVEMVVPSGEASKSYAFLEQVLDRMLAEKMNRNWVVVAIGGGVTGDLAGFAASVFMRGIPVVQVPTTLLAQVDSSIGGKTAINTARGKNLVGSFHQPLLVLSDVDFLQSLGRAEFAGSMAEIVKYGIIMDRPLMEYLEQHQNYDYARLVRLCSLDKAYVVARDEKEGGLRRILNFGHTLGHAVEKSFDYKIHHGLGVAVGMLFATWLSCDLGLLAKKEMIRIIGLIRRLEMIPASLELPGPAVLADAMALDKKSSAAGIHFILSDGVGSAFDRNITSGELLEAYTRFSDGYKELL